MIERRRAAVLAAAEGVGHRGDLIVSEHVRLDAGRGDGSRLLQTLLTRDGSAAHIDVVERWSPSGVWLSDTAVAELGLRRGSRSLPIAGVYRDIAKSPIHVAGRTAARRGRAGSRTRTLRRPRR